MSQDVQSSICSLRLHHIQALRISDRVNMGVPGRGGSGRGRGRNSRPVPGIDADAPYLQQH